MASCPEMTKEKERRRRRWLEKQRRRLVVVLPHQEGPHQHQRHYPNTAACLLSNQLSHIGAMRVSTTIGTEENHQTRNTHTETKQRAWGPHRNKYKKTRNLPHRKKLRLYWETSDREQWLACPSSGWHRAKRFRKERKTERLGEKTEKSLDFERRGVIWWPTFHEWKRHSPWTRNTGRQQMRGLGLMSRERRITTTVFLAWGQKPFSKTKEKVRAPWFLWILSDFSWMPSPCDF
jgi:hypothetical protein